MKKEKGITLIALTIYVILFIGLMGMLAVFTTDFNSGIGRVQHNMTSPEEFNKFNIEFVRDIKSSYYANINKSGDDVTIILDNGANYRYVKSENAIYKNKAKISKNIASFNAISEQSTKGKNVIRIKITTGKNEQSIIFSKNISYVLRYW